MLLCSLTMKEFLPSTSINLVSHATSHIPTKSHGTLKEVSPDNGRIKVLYLLVLLTEFNRWDISELAVLNRTGRWFLTIVNLSEPIPDEVFEKQTPLTDYSDTLEIKEFAHPYSLRTWTSGCYYYNEKTKAWVADGMALRWSEYGTTHCRSDHLTTFGNGFHVVDNKVDFDYIFSEASFEDNVTIYVCIIVTLLCFLFLLIWSRYYFFYFCIPWF